MKATSLRELNEDERRFADFSITSDGMLLDYSKEKVDTAVLQALQKLASASEVESARSRLFGGETMNFTEQRRVLHMALRGGLDKDLTIDGQGVVQQVDAVLDRFLDFAESLRNAGYLSSTGQAFTDVINIGIGGSDLGPAMVTQALSTWHDGPALHFVSNIDGDQLFSLLRTLNCDTTLVIVSSKTMSTSETIQNFETALDWLKAGLGDRFGHHLAAVSTNFEATRKYRIDDQRVFPFWDWVGGRYSVWSAIGLPIAIAIGRQAFRNFLAGARAMDTHFLNAPMTENMPIVYALLGIWRRNFMNWPGVAVIPYSHCLSRFPAYIQQLDMESNGKSVTSQGQAVSESTGPLILGESGTNCQHSFFQWLHQGTDIVPVDFIFAANGSDAAGSQRYISHHNQLITNAIAQSNALAFGLDRQQVIASMQAAGCDDEEIDRLAPHREFKGDRPSTVILVDRFTPYQLGKLIALYEHKVFVQGVIWDINSYDQWGVELGKKLANQLTPAVAGRQFPQQIDGATRALIEKIHQYQDAHQ